METNASQPNNLIRNKSSDGTQPSELRAKYAPGTPFITSSDSFTIYLGRGEYHSISLKTGGHRTLHQILESLSNRRDDPSMQQRVPRDAEGNTVDADTPIEQLGMKEIVCLEKDLLSSTSNPHLTLPSERPLDHRLLLRLFREIVLSLSDNKIGNRTFPNSFKASDLVSLLMDRQGLSQADAIAFGHCLQTHQLIHHVLLRANFSNSDTLLFQLYPDDFHQKVFWDDLVDRRDTSHVLPQTYALANYVPNLVIRYLSRTNGEPKYPFSETIQAAVLFADLSGFTALTESLVSKGSAGVEKLTQLLNDYFDRMVSVILEHGGDVVKFAGDALIVLWPTDSAVGLRYSIMIASQCSIALLEELEHLDANGSALTLHMGISAGTLNCLYLGSLIRSEIAVSGVPLDEAAACEGLAKPGEIVFSKTVKEYAGDSYIASEPCGFNSEAFRLLHLNTVFRPAEVALPIRASFHDAMKAFVPRAVSTHLQRVGNDNYLAQIRSASVLFISIPVTRNDSDPARFASDLHASFTAIYNVVFEYEGSIRQFIVDDKGIVCIVVFGLPPTTHEDDPQRAVLAALKISQSLNEKLSAYPSIGVTSGKVFCGPVGSQDRREYAVVGSVVNMAARIMGKAQGRVLCDRATFIASQRRFDFNVLPPVTVKGRLEPLDIFHALAEIVDTAHRRRLFASKAKAKRRSGLRLSAKLSDSHLVGREAESAKIKQAFNLLAQARADPEAETKQIVLTIEGDAGTGKSALVSEILRQATTASVRLFTTYAYSSDVSTPFSCLRGVLTRALNLLLAPRNLSVGSERDPAIFTNCLATLVPETCIPYLPVLKDIHPSLPLLEDTFTHRLSGEQRSYKVAHVCAEILNASSIKIFVFEDVQWMDSLSWATVIQLSRILQPACMLVVTMRPTPGPWTTDFEELTSARNPTTKIIRLHLSKLDKNDIQKIIAFTCGCVPEAVSAGVLDPVYELSDGNPLVATELLNHQVQLGKIIIADGRCELKQGYTSSDIALGDKSTATILLSKFDPLGPIEQLILKIAAVSGRHFSSKMIATVAEEISADMPSFTDIGTALSSLCTAGFIVKRDEHHHSFTFRSPIQREAIYNVMLKEQRKLLHSKIAKWLEANMELPDPSQLAYHYKGAEEWSVALAFLNRCAFNALERASFREALALYSDCMETVGNLRFEEAAAFRFDIAHWNRCLGECMFNIYNFEGALGHFGIALRTLSRVHPQPGCSNVPELIQGITDRFAELQKRKKKHAQYTPRTDAGLFLWREASKEEKDELKRKGTHDAVQAYLTYAIIKFYSSEADQSTFCALTALKDAAALGMKSEYIALAGQCALDLYCQGRHDLALQYPSSHANVFRRNFLGFISPFTHGILCLS